MPDFSQVVEWEKVSLIGRFSPYENFPVWQFSSEFRKLCPYLCDCPVIFGNGAELTFKMSYTADLEMPRNWV